MLAVLSLEGQEYVSGNRLTMILELTIADQQESRTAFFPVTNRLTGTAPTEVEGPLRCGDPREEVFGGATLRQRSSGQIRGRRRSAMSATNRAAPIVDQMMGNCTVPT